MLSGFSFRGSAFAFFGHCGGDFIKSIHNDFGLGYTFITLVVGGARSEISNHIRFSGVL